ncbi:winged helix DNA-binding domain-containing protein [Bacteroides sp.]|uniref:winged helix DNA-binding domain-containing protein n=1 Tax=Bacteroides sp. TaxID=29523 RepID=UPI00262DF29C|nr:winged helix DNA-binding domain-containing protein [Bacteroides sp.]MDD3040249.1 winged helix DNA-binding domain-containing protein [Bacteroides sp.]
MNLFTIRLLNQQLLKPQFCHPKELVSWMGAMQAQEYTMVKWAVGMRLKLATIQTVEKALQEGDILRTHVMRPTWHLVAAEDIRWMLKLSAQRIKAANDSYAKGHSLDITEEVYTKSNNLLEKILCGNKSLTKQDIAEHYEHSGLLADQYHMTRFLARAEVEGVVCSGEGEGRKHTYMLLEERVAPVPEITKDEALARLARSYFRSHAPATLQDFLWWSGLSISEARQAVYLIDSELIAEQWKDQTWYIHNSCRTRGKSADNLHLLPSYDEYLIAYKDRTDVLPKEFYPKAFTNNGLFYPVLLHEGRVVGNWSKSVKKVGIDLQHSFFEENACMAEALLDKANDEYKQFLML